VDGKPLEKCLPMRKSGCAYPAFTLSAESKFKDGCSIQSGQDRQKQPPAAIPTSLRCVTEVCLVSGGGEGGNSAFNGKIVKVVRGFPEYNPPGDATFGRWQSGLPCQASGNYADFLTIAG